jgi:hypothetical protein
MEVIGMNMNTAKKLHNGDEVTVKGTNEVTTVIDAYVEGNVVVIECCLKDEGFTKLRHTDVK